jgi:hypothetical protein
MVKLVLSLSLLAGSLIVGLPKEASAYCESYCCDYLCFQGQCSCTSIRECYQVGGSCICEEFCKPNWGGGLD